MKAAVEIHGVNGNEFESASGRQRLSGSFPGGKSSPARDPRAQRRLRGSAGGERAKCQRSSGHRGQ